MEGEELWDLPGAPAAAESAREDKLDELRAQRARLQGLRLVQGLCDEELLSRIAAVHEGLQLPRASAWRALFGEDRVVDKAAATAADAMASGESSTAAAAPALAREDSLEMDLYGDLGMDDEGMDLYGDLDMSTPGTPGKTKASSALDPQVLETRMGAVRAVHDKLAALEKRQAAALLRDAHAREYGPRGGDGGATAGEEVPEAVQPAALATAARAALEERRRAAEESAAAAEELLGP
mmetsp:Transcript_1127/g.3084  ORF Transcript_1127/g.3084 Transcript_1127/m.3084 type:complete len:238 (-) Transcript_1127:110-823(-)